MVSNVFSIINYINIVMFENSKDIKIELIGYNFINNGTTDINIFVDTEPSNNSSDKKYDIFFANFTREEMIELADSMMQEAILSCLIINIDNKCFDAVRDIFVKNYNNYQLNKNVGQWN